jgi:quercetin dioxygenase-like cupin family protein
MKFGFKCLLLVGATMMLLAQKPGIQRTIVLKADVSAPGREVQVARVEIAPAAYAGRHTHPGEEISYVMEGDLEVLIEGKPPLKVKPGESFIVPAGAKHDAHNAGTTPVRLVAMYLIEKGKPLATPAP